MCVGVLLPDPMSHVSLGAPTISSVATTRPFHFIVGKDEEVHKHEASVLRSSECHGRLGSGGLVADVAILLGRIRLSYGW